MFSRSINYLNKIGNIYHMNNVTNFCKNFVISNDDKEKIKYQIGCKFEEGLAEDPNVYMYSPVKMLPTYISIFPEQNHEGCFISIDFGGTNPRFVCIILEEGKLITEYISNKIPDDIKTSNSEMLFDYLAKCLKEGLTKLNMENQEIRYVGFTFSFPCAQNALDHGILLHWTKGFNIKNVEGEDVVSLLLKSCKKINLKIDNFCLLNDTTGTLLCGSYEDRNTYIGLINGTGTNACYLEQCEKVQRLKPNMHIDENVIINTEWGSLGQDGCLDKILTRYDRILDESSINPKEQIFEKCISGLYLPELVRIILVHESKNFNIFQNMPERFLVPYVIDGSFLSMVFEPYTFIKAFEDQFQYILSWREFQIIKEISDVIIHRAAVLTAIALSKLLDRVPSKIVTIAVDGSMCTKHPTYLFLVSQELRTHNSKIFEFKHVGDGSGKGSALAACIATSNHNK